MRKLVGINSRDLRTGFLHVPFMNTRRDFLKLTASAGLLGASLVRAAEKSSPPAATAVASPRAGGEDRAEWTQMAGRLAGPLLSALAERRLKSLMPVESHPSSHDRPNFTYLEGFGRLLAGLAPWFETASGQPGEDKLRSELVAFARAGLDAATDPASPDFMNFSRGQQPLVDAAFLAQALRRASSAECDRCAAIVTGDSTGRKQLETFRDDGGGLFPVHR